jgi:lipopolysaccharide/colanic/teichoic acid biosynthesis glycosyltransferase
LRVPVSCLRLYFVLPRVGRWAVVTQASDAGFDGILGHDALRNWAVVDATTAVVRLDRYRRPKRVLDMLITCALLIVLAPVLLAIALAVRLDSGGPIMFRQTRIGLHGRSFTMLKFRTMRAERRRRNAGPPTGVLERRRRHKSIGDPRVTRVGQFLRRSCLDELPQLWNVLRGDMSLVGPRPEIPSIVNQYEPWQHLRHQVAPGITGWWQINRAADKLMHEATELDIYYIQHCSFLLDALIIARTFGAIVAGRGAY